SASSASTEPTELSPWLNEPTRLGPHGTMNFTSATVQRSACTPAGTRRRSSQRTSAVSSTSTVPFWSEAQTSAPSVAVASSSAISMSVIVSSAPSLRTLQLLLDAAQVLLGEGLVLDELEHELVGAPVEDRADELAQPLAPRRHLLERRPVDEGLARLVDLHRPLLLHPAEQRHDRRVGQLGAAERPDLGDGGAAEVPKDLHDRELGLGERGWLARHDRNTTPVV